MSAADMGPRRHVPAPSELPARDAAALDLAAAGLPVSDAAAPPGLRWRRRFPGAEAQLREVRRWLGTLLPDCPARDDVSCVATELGTNAVRHTASGRGGAFAIEITWHPALVRVIVADGGAASGPRRPAGPPWEGDPDDEHGRGLLLVEGLAASTGVSGDHRGRQVWAEIPWAAPVTPRDRYAEAIQAGHASLAGAAGSAPAWFGRATREYWALARGRLIAAASAHDLARELGPVLSGPGAGMTGSGAAVASGGLLPAA